MEGTNICQVRYTPAYSEKRKKKALLFCKVLSNPYKVTLKNNPLVLSLSITLTALQENMAKRDCTLVCVCWLDVEAPSLVLSKNKTCFSKICRV